mmetsp:Transcript_10037/g.17771  ORF Transcript_10037/g.17771 Transcript_10037/m.17771 type:complete len:172 (-) Transcript_10037:552-1067(-)
MCPPPSTTATTGKLKFSKEKCNNSIAEVVKSSSSNLHASLLMISTQHAGPSSTFRKRLASDGSLKTTVPLYGVDRKLPPSHSVGSLDEVSKLRKRAGRVCCYNCGFRFLVHFNANPSDSSFCSKDCKASYLLTHNELTHNGGVEEEACLRTVEKELGEAKEMDVHFLMSEA